MKSKIYLSALAHPILQEYLKSEGYDLCLIPENDIVYREVSSHADLYMCRLGAGAEAPVLHIEDKTELGFRYPDNIRYNGVCMGSFFIHNTKYTSPRLLKAVKEKNMALINVRQGYTKCNMAVIDSHAAITSDTGIYNALASVPGEPFDILLIRPGYVELKGFPYGFLGGSSGRIGKEIVFNGNLEEHPDFRKIQVFIESHGLSLKYFKEYPLTDIGSIISESERIQI